MVNLQFTLVETLWKTFWRFSQSQAGDATLAVLVLISQISAVLKSKKPLSLQNMTIGCEILILKFLRVCVCVCISHDESEKRLPKSCLVLLCKYEPVLRWSRDCDNSLYQGLVEILIPDVLRPIPSKDV